MPQSLAKVLIHMVWSTKHRTRLLNDKQVRKELYAYMATVLGNMDSPALIINGVKDHVHVLCLMSRKFTLAQLFEAVRADSSKWIKSKGLRVRGVLLARRIWSLFGQRIELSGNQEIH